MAYRNPIFYLDNAGTRRNATGGSAFNPSFPRERLFDNSPAKIARFNVDQADNAISVDQGTGGPFTLDTAIIPAGHNLDGATIEWETSPLSAVWSSWGTTVVSGDGVIFQSLPSTTERWIRARIATSGLWEFTELYFSLARTPVRGPDPAWRRPDIEPVDGAEGPYRFSVVRLAPNRRVWRMTWRRTRPEAANDDEALFRDLRAMSPDSPFYWANPEAAAADPPVYVRAVEFRRVEQSHGAPSVGPVSFDYEITLEEQTA